MMSGEKGEYTFTWRITNFSASLHNIDDSLESPNFSIESLHGSQWCLFLKESKNEEFIECYISCEKLDANIEKTTIDFDLQLLDENEVVLNTNKFKSVEFDSKGSNWGVNKLLEINKLIKEMENWKEDCVTFRCVIKSEELTNQMCLRSDAFTVIGGGRSYLKWDMKMPTLLKFSETQSFAISNICKIEIVFSYASEEAVEISIRVKECQLELPRKMTLKITLLDRIGRELVSKRAFHLLESEEVWIFPTFITEEHLKICEIDSNHFELKLHCEAYVTDDDNSYSVEYYRCSSSSNLDSILRKSNALATQNDFRAMFLNKQFSDVTIRTDNFEFPAHKFVLKVRSPVFASMFEHDMLENRTGVLDIADLDGKTLKSFLEFLYSNTVADLDYDCAINLLIAADKYRVPSLVNECAYFLKSVLSFENACEIITNADLVNCEDLKSFAMYFITLNAAKVLSSPGWMKCMEGNMKLASYILSKLSENIELKYKTIEQS